MIRMVLVLCFGLYVTAMVLGEDRGQKRHGLMLADSQTELVIAADPKQAAAASQPSAGFVPAQPVMLAAAPAVSPKPAAAEPVVAAPTPEALPAPRVTGGTLYTVATRRANVRDGPGRSFAVVGSLAQGEQVLVVTEAQPIEGWLRIRIEGDGVEGYMSASLLTRSE